MRINNTMAQTAVRYMNYHNDRVAGCIYRLSSGKRINSAADDPAGMVIAQRFKAQLHSLDARIRSTEYAQASLDTTHSDMMSRQNLLGRMYEIAIQVSSDTLSWDDKNLLMIEFNELAKEFSGMTMRQTGMEVVAINYGSRKGELAYKSGNKIYIDGDWQNIDTLVPTEPSKLMEKLNLDDAVEFDGEKAEFGEIVIEKQGDSKLDGAVPTVESEPATIGLIDFVKNMISSNLSTLGDLGAAASALSFRLDRLYIERENAMEALSRIEDTDFAKELAEFVKEKVLLQCATLMAAQANAQPENVLYLLESVKQ